MLSYSKLAFFPKTSWHLLVTGKNYSYFETAVSTWSLLFLLFIMVTLNALHIFSWMHAHTLTTAPPIPKMFKVRFSSSFCFVVQPLISNCVRNYLFVYLFIFDVNNIHDTRGSSPWMASVLVWRMTGICACSEVTSAQCRTDSCSVLRGMHTRWKPVGIELSQYYLCK